MKDEVVMTVQREGDKFRVYGPQGWGVGVDFPSWEAARYAADAIERAARGEIAQVQS